jgi:hypothetical protein
MSDFEVRAPRVRDARDLCEQTGARAVLVIAFVDGKFGAASYGETKAECASVAKTLDEIVAWLQRGAIPAPELR